MTRATPEGSVNFRDLGSLPLVDGGRTVPGVLFRSAALAGVTDQGWRDLVGRGVRTVVDLRTPSERRQAPTRAPEGVRVLELPLLEGAMSPELFAQLDGDLTRLPTLLQLYTDMVADGAAAFAEVARTVANGDAGVLVHCTAGKDRTGVAIALLLSAVGVERSAVVADYAETQSQLSGAWVERTLAGLARLGVPAVPQLTDLATTSPAAVMERLLADLDATGGASAALASGGLSEAELECLTHRLTAPVRAG